MHDVTRGRDDSVCCIVGRPGTGLMRSANRKGGCRCGASEGEDGGCRVRGDDRGHGWVGRSFHTHFGGERGDVGKARSPDCESGGGLC